MHYRVNGRSPDGRSGAWRVLAASSAEEAVTRAREAWAADYPELDSVEEETAEPKIAYRVALRSADGVDGDRVYKEATSEDIATELVLAERPGLEHDATYPDDPA